MSLEEQFCRIDQEQDHRASGEMHTARDTSQDAVEQQTYIDDISVQEYEIPAQLKAPQYDYVLFFCQKDREKALAYHEELQTLAESNGFKLRGCTYDDHNEFPWIQAEWQCAEEAIKRSTYMLFYMTANCEEEQTDKIFETHVNEALTKSLKDETKRWGFIPVFTKPKDDFQYIPYGLSSLKGLVPDDPYYKRQVKSLFTCDACRDKKIRREVDQENKKHQWIQKRKKQKQEEMRRDRNAGVADVEEFSKQNGQPLEIGAGAAAAHHSQPPKVYNINIVNSSNIHVGDKNIYTLSPVVGQKEDCNTSNNYLQDAGADEMVEGEQLENTEEDAKLYQSSDVPLGEDKLQARESGDGMEMADVDADCTENESKLVHLKEDLISTCTTL
ncbi:uncharacterized protein LOC106172349 [Lingula anatina]|uniref:Uncharacterized protein LOC106172349 n=1 Tax=Lingula anatina TaxID=7574 RepID=A0A1S3JEZ0_LINAN|nr:uncharacterized protein LOC106172349 [Lingula anatina]|eukprot:XP_013408459.1 uncharacterized protein LOC106172349 [Lingula anatina]